MYTNLGQRSGILNLATILEGRYQSQPGMGLGISGAWRLIDQFEAESVPGAGTTIWLKKLLPKRFPVNSGGGSGAHCE
jgi:anti-sigma regulatory factor (Ser/Thr protein kinase)